MYLVINLGLKSIRGIVFDLQGEQVYSKAFPVHTSLFNERVEQDVNEWRTLLKLILEDLHTNTNLSATIKFISATTSSSCIFGVDENISPTTKVLMVSDKRSIDQVKSINEVLSASKENQNLLAVTSSLIPKALWFKENLPEIFDQTKYWLGAGEYINYFFTGELFTDPLNAGKAFYNDGRYIKDIIEKLGVNSMSLPQVKEIGSEFTILKTIITTYKFHPDCKYILNTYDAICAVIGSSTGEEKNACDVSGTVTSVRTLSKNYDINGNGILLCQPLDYLNTNLIGASNNLGGGIIEWYKQAIFQVNKEEEDVYFSMENFARQARVGSGGIIFIPYLLGERAPIRLPNASGTFFGLDRSSTLKEITRAVFESTAYVSKDLLDLIIDSGVEIDSLTVSGGLARFDLINQIKADVTGIPVKVVENFESTSVGAFIIMAISTGLFNSLVEAQSNSVRVRKIIMPSKKNHEYYQKSFDLYKRLVQNLSSMYEDHGTLKKIRERHDVEIVKNL